MQSYLNNGFILEDADKIYQKSDHENLIITYLQLEKGKNLHKCLS